MVEAIQSYRETNESCQGTGIGAAQGRASSLSDRSSYAAKSAGWRWQRSRLAFRPRARESYRPIARLS